MDDLLSRMLEIEAQGNAEVKEAEARAVSIREEGSAELTRINSEFSAGLARECEAIEAAAMEEGRKEYESVLTGAKQKVEESEAAFAAIINAGEEAIYREVLGI